MIHRNTVVFVVFAVPFLLASAQCEEFTFEIDPERSFLTANAFVKAVGAPTVAQGEGADITTYSGTITVDLDVFETPSEIRFISAEAIAADSGDWLPQDEGGSDGDPGDATAANFGIVLDAGPAGVLFGAFRETVFTIESEDYSLSDGFFDSGQNFITSQGFLDSNIISVALGNSFGRDDTTGDNAINVSEEAGSYLFGADGVGTLTIPVDLDFLSGADDGVDFLFDGMLVATFGTPTRIAGDANEDGRVDASDLNAIGLNWQQMDKSWSDGDFTGDGIVDAADLNVVGLNWQTGVPAAAVPEPSAVVLFAGSLLITIVIRRYSAASRAND